MRRALSRPFRRFPAWAVGELRAFENHRRREAILRGPPAVAYRTRTARSDALVVRGAGYDDNLDARGGRPALDIIVITRTARSDALIVRGTGYDVDHLDPPRAAKP